jgi:16S rRNA (guanine527-N7)-methyltransferase
MILSCRAGLRHSSELLYWGRKFLKKKHMHALPNGIIALKGGDLRPEINALPGKGGNYTDVFPHP